MGILSANHQTTSQAPVVRRISMADLNWALREGWRDFQAKRGDLLFIGILYPLAGLIAATFALRQSLLPLLFPLVAGLSIMGPAVAAGFYELARRREEGHDPRWRHFFDVLRGPSRGPLLALTALLLILFFGWLAAAWTIYQEIFGAAPPATPGDFLSRLFTTSEGWTLILVGNLTGFVFALVTLVISVVSFPMVVDRPVDPEIAIATSVRAVMRNPREMAAWGLRIALLLLIGSLPLFIGLAVVLPVLGYSTWHLYTRLVER
ncbi:hypothetical protein CLG96_09050 [Sphingomonas oleivorans]|uniref:DUF2189 domain-containing protein n=1 Tax=Sphingomonas oleivorans TaxID=1735121 RepID=A0A2T5FYF2_9SPHN|nr:DUF2189 domain-containing protein [Sphingomonas oleivorans]PTQ11568.1 hypothetical protein CLG96_09050 [Sphingomonas oleivorans]